jgi:hypothetical protein
VIVPFATRVERRAVSSAPRSGLPGFVVFETTRVEVCVTFVVFDEAVATPKEPAVRATVVTATAITFFFDDICMSPCPILSASFRVADLVVINTAMLRKIAREPEGTL